MLKAYQKGYRAFAERISPAAYLTDTKILNSAQLEAVNFEGPGALLVIAGPGSGKTTVIIRRVRHLLEVNKVPAGKILVMTFTRDAALSMEQRFFEEMRGLTEDTELTQHHYSYQSVNFGTFHSVFFQILKQSHVINDTTLMTEPEKKKILMPILSFFAPENRKNEAAKVCKEMFSAISYYKNTGNKIAAIDKLPEIWHENFLKIYEGYCLAMREAGRLDYDDILWECKRVLQSDGRLREYWQGRFTHILLDEFQDINPVQYEIIKLLAGDGRNVFAVGDDDQSIYGFRGANPACMMQFEKEFEARRVVLNINYRSRPEIVEMSKRMIEGNKNRFQKELRAAEDLHAERELRAAQDVHAERELLAAEKPDSERVSRAAEASKIRENGDGQECRAFLIRGFIDRQSQYAYLREACKEGTCAVLFRTNRLLQRFLVQLKREDIPYYTREKSGSPYDHEAVKDIFAYLLLGKRRIMGGGRIGGGRYGEGRNGEGRNGEGTYGVGDREMVEALYRIVNKPSRYVSRDFLAGAMREIRPVEGDLMQSLLSYSKICNEGLFEALERLQLHLNQIKNMNLFLAVQYVRKIVGYDRWVAENFAKYPETGEEYMETLDWLLQEAKEFEDYEHWMAFVEELRQEGRERGRTEKEGTERGRTAGEIKEQDAQNHAGDGSRPVQVMTVHASKGLEFDRVFIPDCNERVFPHGQMLDEETLEEERRIFYVGMTRAKEQLELLYVAGTREHPKEPSRFLKGLGEEK